MRLASLLFHITVSAFLVKQATSQNGSAVDSSLSVGSSINHHQTTAVTALAKGVEDELSATESKIEGGMIRDVIFWLFVPSAFLIYVLNIAYCMRRVWVKRRAKRKQESTKPSPAVNEAAMTLYGIPEMDVMGAALERESNAAISVTPQTPTPLDFPPDKQPGPENTNSPVFAMADEGIVPIGKDKDKEERVPSGPRKPGSKPTDSLYGVPSLIYRPSNAPPEPPAAPGAKGKRKARKEDDSLYGLPSLSSLYIPPPKQK